MASVLNKTNFLFYPSVNTPDYSPDEWLINPDLSQVAGIAQMYWKIVDDQVVPMNDTERAEADRLAPFGGSTDLETVRAAKLMWVNKTRDDNLHGGWTFNSVLYDSDAQATQNIAGTQTLLNSGYTLPSDFTWRARDNTNHPFNNDLFLRFFTAATMWREAIYRASWMHKANVMGLTTVDSIIDYNHATGWAKGYNYDDTNGYQVVF